MRDGLDIVVDARVVPSMRRPKRRPRELEKLVLSLLELVRRDITGNHALRDELFELVVDDIELLPRSGEAFPDLLDPVVVLLDDVEHDAGFLHRFSRRALLRSLLFASHSDSPSLSSSASHAHPD